MPLPAKLKKGASKKKKQEVIGKTMHDLKRGPHHKDRTRAQEIAIAERQAGNSKPKKKSEKQQSSKRPRNRGRG